MKTSVELVALAEASALKRQRVALRRQAVIRWLTANPGEPLTACRRATGVGEVLIEQVAKEIGYQRGGIGIRAKQKTFTQVREKDCLVSRGARNES